MAARIKTGQTMVEAMDVMANGDLCVMDRLLEVMETAAQIDPDDVMNRTYKCGFGSLRSMDQADIHDDKILELFNLCENDVVKAVACVRASQMGILSVADLHTAMKKQVGLNFDEIIGKLQAKLPRFAQNYEFNQ